MGDLQWALLLGYSMGQAASRSMMMQDDLMAVFALLHLLLSIIEGIEVLKEVGCYVV